MDDKHREYLKSKLAALEEIDKNQTTKKNKSDAIKWYLKIFALFALAAFLIISYK